MEFRRGDLVEVHWLDILEDSVGDPENADLAPRLSVGYFWSVKVSHGIQALVTTTTIDVGTTGQNGYCVYPLSAVANIKMIRRGKGKVYRGQSSFAWSRPETVGASGSGHDSAGDAGQRSGKAAVRGAGHLAVVSPKVHEGSGDAAPAAVE